MLLAVRISSYGCTWEVWRTLKKLELLSAAPRATLTLLSCSPNFPRASITRYTHAKHEPILNFSMSPSWIWSDKITNERVARVGYNHFISNKGKWNNCFSKFSNRVLPPIFISTILQSVRKENLAHYFPYDVKLGLLAHSRRFLANQKLEMQ